MKHGIFYCAKTRHNLFCSLLCICAMVSMAGCRSSRNNVEETHREVHATVNETLNTDTLNTASASSETQTDTAAIRATERTVFSLKRDSAGRVVEIRTERTTNINANTKRRADRDLGFYGFNATRHYEASVSMDSVTQKEEEIKKDVKVGIPLEAIIACGMAAILIIFYTGDWIIRLWKRRKTR